MIQCTVQCVILFNWCQSIFDGLVIGKWSACLPLPWVAKGFTEIRRSWNQNNSPTHEKCPCNWHLPCCQGMVIQSQFSIQNNPFMKYTICISNVYLFWCQYLTIAFIYCRWVPSVLWYETHQNSNLNVSLLLLQLSLPNLLKPCVKLRMKM